MYCRDRWRRFAKFKGRFLGAHGDFRVAVGGLQADMTKPTPDHVGINPGLEQLDGTGMPKKVRADVAS